MMLQILIIFKHKEFIINWLHNSIVKKYATESSGWKATLNDSLKLPLLPVI